MEAREVERESREGGRERGGVRVGVGGGERRRSESG